MREIQIKSDKKGTQVALSSKRKITVCWPVYKSPKCVHTLHTCGKKLWRQQQQQHRFDMAQLSPEFHEYFKVVCSNYEHLRSLGVCVCNTLCIQHLKEYHHFQQCGWALLFYCRPPNSDKTFVSLKITAQLFPLFCPAFLRCTFIYIFFFGLFRVSSSPLHIK